MNDDELSRIGEMARADQAIPSVWRRVADGSATATELAALEAQAAKDPQVALMLARFRPLGAEEENGMARRLVAHRRRAAWKQAVAISAAFAAAAGLVAMSLRTEPALPAYSLTAQDGDRLYRGDESSPSLVHHIDSALILNLRPQQAVSEAVSIETYRLRGGRLTSVPARWTIASSGAARLDVRVGDLFPEPGRVQLRIVVRAARKPPIGLDEIVSGSTLQTGYRLVVHDFRVMGSERDDR
ncbi:MAG: hypothetical protein AAFN74_16250 [Myxococcota bacterium]